MTASTLTSAYPRSVDDLLPAARELMTELGEVPARNRLMREFHVGAPKADELRKRLLVEHTRDIARREQQTSATVSDPDTPGIGEVPAPPVGEVHTVARPPDTDRPSDRTETLRTAMAIRGALLAPQTDPVSDPGTTGSTPTAAPHPDPASPASAAAPSSQAEVPGHPGSNITTPTPTPGKRVRPVRSWPVLLLALPAFVAIWSGWVGLGGLTGFGVVHPLPGIWDSLSLDTAITLPIGVETYAAFALRAWLSGRIPERARRFAKWSAIGSLILGALGQVAYHLMESAGMTSAPWWITTLVACLPVAVLGMGAALAHLMHTDES